MSDTNSKAFLDALSKLSEEERDKALDEIGGDAHATAHDMLKRFVSSFDENDPMQTLLALVFGGTLSAFATFAYNELQKKPSLSRFEVQNLMCDALNEQILGLKKSQRHIKEFMDKIEP